ncbi:MAG: DUF4390 domain-containing protein [Syntrophales bacterium]|nr:DUF4390 domain-containing protein [Syntrophales bacterium]
MFIPVEGKKSFKRRKGIVSIFFVLIFCLILFSTSAAEKASIVDIAVTPQNGVLLVFARLMGCFTSGMESAIMAGVPITFTFYFRVYKERSFWFDNCIAQTEIKYTLKYDILKKVFFIYSSVSSEKVVFYDLQSAEKAMSEFTGRISLQENVVSGNDNYYILMKVKLDNVKLPFQLEKILFFVSLWDFETPWYKYYLRF